MDLFSDVTTHRVVPALVARVVSFVTERGDHLLVRCSVIMLYMLCFILLHAFSQMLLFQVRSVGLRVRDHLDYMWVLWWCRTRSVSSEHTAIPFPFVRGNSGPATPRDQSPPGWVTASQVNTPDNSLALSNYKRQSQTINQTDTPQQFL